MAPYTIRWGILATGGIAEKFTKDLMLDPSTRQVTDVAHTVTAAASSSSVSRAADFLKTCQCPPSAKPYGSYEELVQDPNVDIIYVATPHSHHFQNTMLCLLSGKHVLCEKAFTVNEAQARKLCATAREKNLFLMEAVWTRFFPLSIQIRNLIQKGKLGTVHRVIVDNSFCQDIEGTWGANGAKHRMVNPDLAGGALLDLGIYSLTWVFQTLYHTLPPSQRKPPKVLAMVDKYATGVDEKTSILLDFPTTTPPHPPRSSASRSDTKTPSTTPKSAHAHGIALTTFRVATDPDGYNSARPAIRIQGTLGELQIDGPAFRPTVYRFVPFEPHDVQVVKAGPNPGNGDGKGGGGVVETVCDIPGQGMFWEADECARCVKGGRVESEGMGWEESCVIMGVMDEVRRQGGVEYPEGIESVEYPVRL